KKNPDGFELTRAKCNKIQALPYEITLITSNLPSGYFRDLQLIKENFLPTFDTLIDILDMTGRMIGGMTVNRHAAEDARYDLMYSVEEVNRLVKEGVPFRDAYKQVGLAIERGEFNPDKALDHTHIGSTGNLGNDRLRERMKSQLARMDFSIWHKAVDSLLGK
ncbi:MAG: argininosuccinate lyase, partial [Muribaculaceae bacterium]|nr:argininosuccinate lyase [Muribaculaceae bacterium]